MTIREQPREVTATELQKDYARIIRDAEYGHPTTVTRNGKPVAQVVPIPQPAEMTCGHCGALIRESVSGTNWVDGDGSDTCPDGMSHEPAGVAA